MKARWELIQAIIDKHDFKRYLEIGVGSTWWETFPKVKCEFKVGVDPRVTKTQTGPGEVLYNMTSDKFFEQNKEKFDIVFVDGLHLYEQVIRDTVNSWNCLEDIGYIVIHDCLGTNDMIRSREQTINLWTGDVWKAIIWFQRTFPDIFCKILNIDWGCGVIFKAFPRVLDMPDNVDEYMNLEFHWWMMPVVKDPAEILERKP